MSPLPANGVFVFKLNTEWYDFIWRSSSRISTDNSVLRHYVSKCLTWTVLCILLCIPQSSLDRPLLLTRRFRALRALPSSSSRGVTGGLRPPDPSKGVWRQEGFTSSPLTYTLYKPILHYTLHSTALLPPPTLLPPVPLPLTHFFIGGPPYTPPPPPSPPTPCTE